ncbi:MAG TPA: amino acid permease [Candidatus Acidoferrum sp.]|jgi:APA family basic amino acid/polyamine antiporter|nr:amino acid permease [Candidatus Acidoferrum sp.]
MPAATESKTPVAQPALLRQLGFFSATALVISNMAGTGIFATTGFMAGDLGSAWVILAAWTVGALFAFAGALSYSELGVNFPRSGGEYVYLSEAYGPSWGFMTGWVSFFAGFSAPIAAAALAFSDYLGYFFPVLKHDHLYTTIGSGTLSLRLGAGQAAASALIALFTILNCVGIKRTAVVQNILTGTKLAVICALILFGFLLGHGDWAHFSQPAVRTSTLSLPVQFVVSLIWVMVGYSGWNAATYVAGELKQPERTLPAALAAGTGIVAALYVGLNLVFIYSTPLENMKGVMAIGALSASNLFGAGIAGVFAAMMAASIMATVNAMVTIGPRVYYAMAQKRAFFPAAAQVHPRWRTPVVAIIAQGLCAMLMTLTPFPELMVFIGMSLTFFTVMAVASVLVLRRRPGWTRLAAVSFCYPLVPLAYIFVGVSMMVYGFIGQPAPSLAAFATVAAGALVYRFAVMKG